MKAVSELCPPKKNREVVFDRNTLTFEVYHAMLASLSLSDFTNKKLKVLICGTGAGVFTMFLKHHMSQWLTQIVTVDTNKLFVELGQQHFGLTLGDSMIESVIEDAHSYVKRATSDTFDLVFMDVCYEAASEEGVQPPGHFLSADFIESLQNILACNGVCAINTMIRK